MFFFSLTHCLKEDIFSFCDYVKQKILQGCHWLKTLEIIPARKRGFLSSFALGEAFIAFSVKNSANECHLCLIWAIWKANVLESVWLAQCQSVSLSFIK